MKIVLNRKKEIEIVRTDNGFWVNRNEILPAIIQTTSPLKAEFVYNGRYYRCVLLKKKTEENTLVLSLNGKLVRIETAFVREFLKNIPDREMKGSSSGIRSPMPGRIVEILVREETKVVRGENLLILEAMKMENILKSPFEGTVKKIHVLPGDIVEKNTLLVSF